MRGASCVCACVCIGHYGGGAPRRGAAGVNEACQNGVTVARCGSTQGWMVWQTQCAVELKLRRR